VNARPRIGVTVGDPAGIGPEIARKAAADASLASLCDIVFYGPSDEAASPVTEREPQNADSGFRIQDEGFRMRDSG